VPAAAAPRTRAAAPGSTSGRTADTIGVAGAPDEPRPVTQQEDAVGSFDRLTPRILTGGDLPTYAGARVAREALQEWLDAGVTHVVDCRMEWTDEEFVAEHAPRVHYFWNGEDDAGQAMPSGWFDRGVGFAREALDTDPRAQVLLHCHAGINRGPSMAYALLLDLGHDPIEAIERIVTARPVAAVGYAADALMWNLARRDADEAETREELLRLDAWLRQHRPWNFPRWIRTS
jgi:protein-tyrosine phosphatase